MPYDSRLKSAPSSSIHITRVALPLHSYLDNMTHSHVPKFGDWDSDNIPYTVYFENAVARDKKALVNPNDPEENSEAFNVYIREVEKTSDEAVKGSTRTRSYSTSSLEQIISHEEGKSNGKIHSHHTAESGNETSNSDYSVIQRVKSSLKESMSVGATFIGSFSSSNLLKSKGGSGSHSLNEHVNPEGALVPEFGAWNVTDPKSGEGYTAIFSEIRKEKQSVSGHVPNKTPSLNNCSNIQNQCGRPPSILSKCCCCLFSSESN